MDIKEIFDEDDFRPHNKVVRILASPKKKTINWGLLYNGIPVDFQFFTWDINKWEIKKEYKHLFRWNGHKWEIREEYKNKINYNNE